MYDLSRLKETIKIKLLNDILIIVPLCEASIRVSYDFLGIAASQSYSTTRIYPF